MLFKDLSRIVVTLDRKDIAMNLHEECLLKYLLNPTDLFNSTELLKLNNELIEKSFFNRSNGKTLKYNAVKI